MCSEIKTIRYAEFIHNTKCSSKRGPNTPSLESPLHLRGLHAKIHRGIVSHRRQSTVIGTLRAKSHHYGAWQRRLPIDASQRVVAGLQAGDSFQSAGHSSGGSGRWCSARAGQSRFRCRARARAKVERWNPTESGSPGCAHTKGVNGRFANDSWTQWTSQKGSKNSSLQLHEKKLLVLTTFNIIITS